MSAEGAGSRGGTGGPGSDQVSPPIDVDAIARGLGSQGPILLNKMVHGLFDAFISVLLFLGPPRAGRQQFCLRFNLPHRGQRGVTAALWLFTLAGKDRQWEATEESGMPGRVARRRHGGHGGVRGQAKQGL